MLLEMLAHVIIMIAGMFAFMLFLLGIGFTVDQIGRRCTVMQIICITSVVSISAIYWALDYLYDITPIIIGAF